MTEIEFKESLFDRNPPVDISTALRALWWQKNGDWNRAHEIAQSDNSEYGAWTHALLHREEGDLSNAAYWYNRANRKISSEPLEKEWDEIVVTIFKSNAST